MRRLRTVFVTALVLAMTGAVGAGLANGQGGPARLGISTS
jgi:hypothetical protein